MVFFTSAINGDFARVHLMGVNPLMASSFVKKMGLGVTPPS
jgi:hypothetical protein